jgi:hypothetical protein
MRIDESAGIGQPATATISTRLHGEAADAFRQAVATLPKEDVQRIMRQSMGSTGWFEPKDVSWSDDVASGAFELRLTGTAELDWRTNPDLGVREYRPPANQGQAARMFPRREPGPGDGAPYVVAYPMYVKAAVEVVLPNKGQGFSVRGVNLDQTIAGYEIKRSAKLVEGVARFDVSMRSVAPEVPASEAEAANKLFRSMSEQEEFIREDKAAAPGGSAPAKAAAPP